MFLNDCLSEIKKKQSPPAEQRQGAIWSGLCVMQETLFVETLLGKANREPSLLAQSRLSLPGQVS